MLDRAFGVARHVEHTQIGADFVLIGPNSINQCLVKARDLKLTATKVVSKGEFMSAVVNKATSISIFSIFCGRFSLIAYFLESRIRHQADWDRQLKASS